MLTNALPLGDATDQNVANNEHRYDLFVEDTLVIASDAHYDFEFIIEPASELVATLAW